MEKTKKILIKKAKTEDLDITKTLNITAQEIFDRKPISVTFTDMGKCGYCKGNRA